MTENDWGMTLKWKNQVLSLIETAPDSFILTSRMLYSVGMGWFWNRPWTGMRLEWRNDPQMNGMILLRREYQDGMTECSRIREFSELRVLPWIKKLPSFGLIRSFQHHSRMREWSGNDQNDCWMLSSHCNFHSLSFKSDMEWRNEVEWGVFRRRRKKMNSEMSVIPPSFRHPGIQTKNKL